jgi:3-oxoacyl-[acyl-carrier protein] reductase
MIDLTGRVCIITGAAAGIGRGIAHGFVRRGAIVVATDAREFTDPMVAMTLTWDVSDPARAKQVVDTVVQRFGKLDALVANAGIYPREDWRSVDAERWRKVLAVNLDGSWYGAKAAAEAMAPRGYGKIVFVSSIEILIGVPVHTHYDASKAGIIGLTRSFARAVGKDGIRVNAVMPGAVRTEGELEQFPDQATVAKRVDELQCLPGRLLPEGIEPSFAFLCSAESDAITGQVLCVDHGLRHY